MKVPTLGDLDRRHALWLPILALVSWGLGALEKFAGHGTAGNVLFAFGGLLLVPAIGFSVAKYRAQTAAQKQAEEFSMLYEGPLALAPPIRLGIDECAETRLLPGGKVPQYVPRTEDHALTASVRHALESGGEGQLLVVMGETKAGKSRALFEALNRAEAEVGQTVYLVAPYNMEALNRLVDVNNASLRSLTDVDLVLWLDRLLPWVDQGLTMRHLDQWWKFGGLVVATHGGERTVSDEGLATPAQALSDMIDGSQQIVVRRINDPDSLPVSSASLSPTQRDEIREHGLAAYLVAGPSLRLALETHCHGAGPRCPAGVAVVLASVDWARCGRTDMMSRSTLRALWEQYDFPGLDHNDKNFELGLAWARTQVAGTISLVVGSDDHYRAYDYAVRLVLDQPDPAEPPLAVWQAAIDGATDTEAAGVGVAALRAGVPDVAVKAFTYAAETTESPELRAQALFNVGIALYQAARKPEALTALKALIDQCAVEPDLTDFVYRAGVARALMKIAAGHYPEATRDLQSLRDSARAAEGLVRQQRRWSQAQEELREFREALGKRLEEEG